MAQLSGIFLGAALVLIVVLMVYRDRRAQPSGEDRLVRVYDRESKSVAWVPRRELSAEMVQRRVRGVEGLVWVRRESGDAR